MHRTSPSLHAPALRLPPHTARSAGLAPRRLHGRQPDGSRAFFASPEELTENANTGPDQPPPAIERARCDQDAGRRQLPPIAAGASPWTPNHIYWVDPAEGTIGRAELDGGNANPAFIAVPPLKVKNSKDEMEDVPANPQYVAVDSEHIYWTKRRAKAKTTKGRSAARTSNGNADKHRSRMHQRGEPAERDRGRCRTRLLGQCGEGSTTRWRSGGPELDGSEVNQSFIPTAKAPSDPGGGGRCQPCLLEVLTDHSGKQWLIRAGTDRVSLRFERNSTFIGHEHRAPRHRRRRRPRLLGEPGRRSDRPG